MPKIRTLGPGTLTIGENTSVKEFMADVTKVTLTPKTDTEDTQTFLDGHDEAGEQTTSWTLEGTIKEDYSTDGLQRWCLANAGKSLPFTFVPSKHGGSQFTGNAQVAPVAIGGDVKKQNDIDFSFVATSIAAADHTPETL